MMNPNDIIRLGLVLIALFGLLSIIFTALHLRSIRGKNGKSLLSASALNLRGLSTSVDAGLTPVISELRRLLNFSRRQDLAQALQDSVNQLRDARNDIYIGHLELQRCAEMLGDALYPLDLALDRLGDIRDMGTQLANISPSTSPGYYDEIRSIMEPRRYEISRARELINQSATEMDKTLINIAQVRKGIEESYNALDDHIAEVIAEKRLSRESHVRLLESVESVRYLASEAPLLLGESTS